MTWMKHSRRPRRPPWWPEGEPWPPMGPPWAWHGMRGRFLWRIGFFLGFLFLLIVAASTIAFWIASGISRGGPHPLFLVRPFGLVFLVLFMILGVLAAGRAFRRVAAPIGDVMEAASRVADGDYSVQVAEQGPPEVRGLTRTFNTMVNRLRATDERRGSLLADISHDLRTPLAVIQGNLEGLLDGVYPRDDAHLGPVLEETRLLARLVEDLHTLALAETGALKLDREPTDLGALITETVASFQRQAGDAGVTLVAELGPDLPVVALDPVRIRQVLENLVVNALHYTPRGGEIRVRCRADTRGRREAVITVSDTGPGIPREDLPHVFDRFYKSRDSRGSGLGLAIAKNLVAAHGGEISADSEARGGTTMQFTLPL